MHRYYYQYKAYFLILALQEIRTMHRYYYQYQCSTTGFRNRSRDIFLFIIILFYLLYIWCEEIFSLKFLYSKILLYFIISL